MLSSRVGLEFKPVTVKGTQMIYKSTGHVLQLEGIIVDDTQSMHSVWIKRLTGVLFDVFKDTCLQAVSSLQVLFAEAMLPLLTQMLLVSPNDTYKRQLQLEVGQFFEKHVQAQVFIYNLL